MRSFMLCFFNFLWISRIVLVFLVSRACFSLRVLWALIDGIYPVIFTMLTLLAWKLRSRLHGMATNNLRMNVYNPTIT